MTPRLHIALIVGSTRDARFAPIVTGWIRRRLDEVDEIDLDVIDLLDEDLPATLPDRAPPSVRAYRERLDRADGFVVVTPEYNHGYPAALKQAIDLAGDEWHAKPVAFVSYGGMSGGIRAVEQLRTVFAEMHAVTIRDSVSLHNPWGSFDEGGHIDPATGADPALDQMVRMIGWWGRALRRARSEEPYAA